MNTGMLRVVFPVHVMAELGIKNYFVTNASGGLNTRYKVGEIMAIKSQINLLPNPLLGREMNFKTIDGKHMERFQPMNESYNDDLREMLKKAGKIADKKVKIREGTYCAVTGPTYETEAESISYRKMKIDAVGMSTTPEVIVARNRGMKVVGFSCITDTIEKDGTNKVTHDEVKAILESEKVKNRLLSTIREFFKLYRKTC
jgi:purine-nucleoside phosphorylase